MNQVAVQFSFPRMVTLLPRVDCRVSRLYICRSTYFSPAAVVCFSASFLFSSGIFSAEVGSSTVHGRSLPEADLRILPDPISRQACLAGRRR